MRPLEELAVAPRPSLLADVSGKITNRVKTKRTRAKGGNGRGYERDDLPGISVISVSMPTPVLELLDRNANAMGISRSEFLRALVIGWRVP